jgi:hypothetical protein
MTPRQAIDGVVEMGLPDGGRILVSFGDEVSGDPDVESGVVVAMLGAGDNEADICRAVTDHADAVGLRAVVSVDRQPMTVLIESSTRESGS